jgi:hypothetical protein
MALVDVLRAQAPEIAPYTFLAESEVETARLTYGELTGTAEVTARWYPRGVGGIRGKSDALGGAASGRDLAELSHEGGEARAELKTGRESGCGPLRW